MIQHVEINGESYPFKFGMREMLTFSQKHGVEFDEVGKEITLDFDLFLDLFCSASKKGARRSENSDLTISEQELEDAIDDDPELFMKLNEAFENSNVVQKMQELDEKKPEAAND